MKTPNGVLRLIRFNTVQHTWEWNSFTGCVFVPAARRLPYAQSRYQIQLYRIYEGQGRIHTLYDPCQVHPFCNKGIVVFLTHRATDELSMPSGASKSTQSTLWISRNWFHVEGLDSCWVVLAKCWHQSGLKSKFQVVSQSHLWNLVLNRFGANILLMNWRLSGLHMTGST